LDVYQHLGIVLLVRQKSTKQMLTRKKYTGMWSWKSEMMAMMINKFPKTVIIYMQMKRSKESLMFCVFCNSQEDKFKCAHHFL
jgi:hypothetical protein